MSYGLGGDEIYYVVQDKDGNVVEIGGGDASVGGLVPTTPPPGGKVTTFPSRDAQSSYVGNLAKAGKSIWPATASTGPTYSWSWSTLPTKTKVAIGAGVALVGYLLLRKKR